VRTHAELDLTNQAKVLEFFSSERPDAVILAAAKVGGIHANFTYPAEFIYENIAIASNVISAAKQHQVKKLLNLGSSCIYPRLAPQPITEDSLLKGELEITNRAYAVAKIAAIELCDAYRKQYSCDFISAMPTNLYGPGDNFDLEKSHVLPAMIRKFHDAKVRGDASVTLWGTGTVRREFMYSDDMARAAVHLFEHYSEPGPINVGTGEDVTIAEAAAIVKQVVGFAGGIQWDTSKPDGTPRKLLSIERLKGTGFKPSVTLEQGIGLTYAWFLANAQHMRG
jgi:GDP-L-fucose synthase